MSESIWKKEIHLRKPKRPQEEQVEQAAAAPEPRESFWKKERHVRRQPEPLPALPEKLLAHYAPPRAQAEETVTIEDTAAPQDAKQSFWKKERHLRRQPEPLPPLPEQLLSRHRAAPPRGMVVVPVAPKIEKRWPSLEAPPVPDEPADEVVYEPSEAEQTLELPSLADLEQHAPEVAPEAAPASPPAWAPSPVAEREPMPQLLPARPSAPGPVQVAVPEVTPEPEPAVAPEAAPASPPAWAPSPVAEREPVPQLLPARPSAPEPVQVAVPEVTPEPEPVALPAPAAEKVPLLKREIRLRRPKAEKAEKPAKAAKPAKPESAEKVSMLKREIHLGRRPKKASTPKGGGDHPITKVVGLRIGSTQLAAAHVRNNGSAEVMQLARVPLDRGLIVGGEVREPVALAKALKAFFAENKLPKKGIRLGVASNRIGVRVLDVPAVEDPKQFDNAIRFRAQELLPIPIADAVLDHVVLGEEEREGETVRRVLLVFAHRDLVSRYVDVCRQAGLRLAGIDLDAFALLRAIGPTADSENPRATAVVSVGHERTVFAVSDGELCEFTRVLEWGSYAIDVAIARALNLSPSQAEPLKVALDLDATELPAGMSPMQFEVARSAVKTEIGALVRELLSSLRFYQSLPDSLALHEVVLSGGGAELPGFAAEVQRGLGVPVRVGDPFERVSFANRVTTPESVGSYAVAVGLGIEA